MDLILVRHAEPIRVDGTDGGVPADPPLHARGSVQAAALAAALASAELDAIYCSPMRRALETAAPVAAAAALDVVVDDGLAEFDRGATSYVPLEDLKAAADPRLERWAAGDLVGFDADPVAFQETVLNALARIVAAHPGETVAVICHGGVINAYVSGRLGATNLTWAHHDYTGITRVVINRQGTATIQRMNDCAHLTPAPPPADLVG